MDAKKDNNTGGGMEEKASSGKNVTSGSESNTKNGYISGDRTRSSSSHQFNTKFTNERP